MLNVSNGLSRPAFHVLCLYLPFTASALVNLRCFQLEYDLAEHPQAKNAERERSLRRSGRADSSDVRARSRLEQ